MIKHLLSYVTADGIYVFVAVCSYMALRVTDGAYWMFEGSPWWAKLFLAVIWPVTLTTRVLRKLLD